MTPNGSLTRFEVQVMITDSLKEYDIGNSLRHKENTQKMDQITSLLMKMVWGILLVFITAAAGLFTDISIHLMGR
jgi:hypothetical protein